MKFIKYNRTAAVVIMIAVILLSLVFGVNRSVGSLERSLVKTYASGSDRYGTVKTDLQKYADYAQNLYAIYTARYGSDDGYSGTLENFRAALDSPLGFTDRRDELFRACSAMYYRLSLDETLPDAQKNSATAYFYEMQSTQARLSANEEYAALAEKYNRAVSSFPASVFVRGGKRIPAVTFGG
ncbi:MAG: hypothetical protein ACI3XP_02880 [Eubacteriales bacterium]